MKRAGATTIIVGVDTGGTFTDLVAIVGDETRVHKVLSTPLDPADAVIRGLHEMLTGTAPDAVTYSSTVATNSLLEKNGARIALITNAGFEDLIEIGRQNRDDLYALAPSRPKPLVDRAMRFGVAERTLFDGAILRALTRAELARVRKLAARSGAEAFAICLLHSYANPKSEESLARALAPIGRPVSISHRILAEYREYERFSTAVVNAYVAPRMSSHLKNLETRLKGARLRIMQSNGTAIGTELARDEPVRTILSGPAAGVIGAASLAREFGTDRFITFDMGGTSTDVSLFDRRARIRTLSHPDGYAVRTPVIDIHTVGAGGGSIARIDAGGSLHVGPESAGADPGPACYGRGSACTVTDADLVAGRLVAEHFLGGGMKLYPERAARAVAELAHRMKTSALAAARGVIRVVNANMERAIRVISVERGYDPRDFALLAFGGAGPMHACELALDLGIRHIVMPRNPGLLCAWGAAGAPLGREYSLTVRETNPDYTRMLARASALVRRARDELKADGGRAIRHDLFVDMRYKGQSYELEITLSPHFIADFHSTHRRTFGHSSPSAAVEVVNIRIRATAAESRARPKRIARRKEVPQSISRGKTLVGDRERMVPIYDREAIGAGARISGPLVVVELSSTAYVAPEFILRADDFGNLHLEDGAMKLDPITLAVMNNRLAAIAEEMGVVLGQTAFSPNIKERHDFSCAIFDARGELVAQAAHIPVHLGSTPLSVRAAIASLDLGRGDIAALNDPFAGGTHLPDLTLVAPIFIGNERRPFGYAANRAHHADIGGIAPGSMALATEIYQEGFRLPPVKIVANGEIARDVMTLFLANTRVREEREGDLRAQIAALSVGSTRLLALVKTSGRATVALAMDALKDYAARLMSAALRELKPGTYRAEDFLDDDGFGTGPIPIRAAIRIGRGKAIVDFTGSAPQVRGSVNANYAITLSATFYVMKCLASEAVPANEGLMRPISLIAPPGSIVNALAPAAVAGGNVETSQRIVDVLFRALAHAAPDRIPAASSGSMSNLTVGGIDRFRARHFSYYETIAGGAGAAKDRPGASGIHTHMTNTLNTPIEALEAYYPMRITEYRIRRGSGGRGRSRGGDGLIRELECLVDSNVSVLTERRTLAPYGLAGGGPGATGKNFIVRGKRRTKLPGKTNVDLKSGERIRIETPGGGGWGRR